MLKSCFREGEMEAGCDEAGRGCLAGPVFAAAVILPEGYHHPVITDSKQLTEIQRETLRLEIENIALCWSVGVASVEEIDEMNILNASFLAMHRAIQGLKICPSFLIIDGNRFTPYPEITHQCIVQGDAKYLSIAAASILAKTHRDQFMRTLHDEYPLYSWHSNKGYGTREHRESLKRNGTTIWHRKSFRLFDEQLEIEFNDASTRRDRSFEL